MPFPAHCCAPGIIGGGAEALSWAYPVASSFSDAGQILTGSGWDAVTWNVHGQVIVPVGSTCYLFYEGGDVWDVEHAEHSKLGVLTSTNGTSWSDYAGNPVAEFQPLTNGGVNPNEEGYWYHGVWRRPNGDWTCVFGGQQGVNSTSVSIDVFVQYSSDGTTWSPNTATGRIKIIDEDDTAFAGYGTANDEIGGTGVWYDETNSLWHVIYTAKNLSGEIYSTYHAQGADIEALAGANSNMFLHVNNNPYVAGGTMRGGAIVDRGNGIIDVLIMATDGTGIGTSKSAICRVPVLPDYSWTSPGPAEVLYYMNEDYSITGPVRTTVGFFPAVSKALIPYIQYSDQDVRMKTATAVQTSDGRLPYSPASARFTASSEQYLSKASGLTGQASSSLFTYCFAIKMIGNPPYAADQTLLRLDIAGGNYRFQIVIRTTGAVGFFARNSSNTIVVNCNTNDSVIDGNNWHTVVVSFDMTDLTKCRMLVDRASVRVTTPATFVDDSVIDFAGTTTAVFGRETAGVKILDAEIADFGFMEGVWFDLSDARVLRRFVTDNNELQNPATDGRRMFLKRPHIFFSGNGAAFPTNQGPGGAFTTNNGPLTNGSSPAGHP